MAHEPPSNPFAAGLRRAWISSSDRAGWGWAVVAGGLGASCVAGAGGSLLWTLIAFLAVTAVVVMGVSGSDAPLTDDRVPRVEARPSNATQDSGSELLSAALEGLRDPAFILDGGAILLLANAPSRLLWTVMPGRHVSQTSRSPELLALVDRALATGAAQSGEARIRSLAEHHLSISVTPLGGVFRAGHAGLLVVMRDLTEQEHLSRMRADFVANASHELRTPLASLKGFLETLRGPAKDDPAVREKFLGIMQEQADRMSRLIDDLLSLSRIEMREHVAPQGRADLAEIAHLVSRSVSALAAEEGIHVVLKGDQVPHAVTGDRDELIQLVQNLLQNAIKYGRRGGKVEVSVSRSGQRVALAVADDGIGISPEHLPRLTERFYRVSAKDSRERGGTGLGLAIAKHILNRHQGELRIDSSLGVGSTFTVLLPAAPDGA